MQAVSARPHFGSRRSTSSVWAPCCSCRKRRESRCPNRGAAYCACRTSGALGRSRLGKDAHVGAGHSMKVEGEISVAAPRARVFERLSDAEFFASCIDGVSDLTHNGGQSYCATFTTRVAFMRFTFKVQVEMTRREPPSDIEAKVEGNPVGVVGRLAAGARTTLSE